MIRRWETAEQVYLIVYSGCTYMKLGKGDIILVEDALMQIFYYGLSADQIICLGSVPEGEVPLVPLRELGHPEMKTVPLDVFMDIHEVIFRVSNS
jgi:hypothetical protein